MAVDRGYGTGTRKATPAASKPKPRRAPRARGSAKPNTPLSQMSKAEYNARLTQQAGMRQVQQRRNDMSANALEAFTGFNRRDGVDAGDLAGLAISIPTAGIGGALARGAARVAKMAIPKATRVSAAATRLAKSAKTKQAVESSFAKYFADQADQEVTNYYAAKFSPTGTRGAMQDAINAERSYLARSKAAQSAAEKISQSNRLNPEDNAANILARLDRLGKIKRRRGGK